MANVIKPKSSTVASKQPTTSDLALGEIAINHADALLYARHPGTGAVQAIGGGSSSITVDSTAADLLSFSSGTLSADDLGTDKIFFWDDSAGRATGLSTGTGLTITGTTLDAHDRAHTITSTSDHTAGNHKVFYSNGSGQIVELPLGSSGQVLQSNGAAAAPTFTTPTSLTTGSVDNAILRAEGTGGATLQNSGLVVDDAIVSFNITGVATTDIITASGHNFTANQGVMFPSLTGGSGLNATTVYFVRDISGNDFKVSTSSGGAAVNFTTDITAGSVIAIQANVTLAQNTTETNSSLVLSPKGTGALIASKPNGAASGGNARGANAVDLQMVRNAATQVASGQESFVGGGNNNTANGIRSVISGGAGNSTTNEGACIGGGGAHSASGQWSSIAGGYQNFSSSQGSCVGGGLFNISSGTQTAVAGGVTNTASGSYSSILCGSNGLSNRYAMQSHAAGQFAAQGDAQRARFVLRNKTTTATATELFLDGSSTRLTIPSGKTIGGTIQIAGATSGGEEAILYIRQFLIRNRGGTTALIGSIQTVGTDIESSALSSADVTLTADDTNDSLKVEVIGISPLTGCTIAASDDKITKTAHGLTNGQDIVFTSITGGAGLTANTTNYWVINATTNDFQVSTTRGGTAVNVTTNYTDATVARVLRWVANVDCTEIGFGV